jgi:nicotinamide riboside kinase
MKIALIGTHGTGKTTLAYDLTGELKKRGVNATMCTEVARRCPLPINRGGSFRGQLWIVVTQIKEEIEAEKDYDVIVCDRSVLDSYVYTYYIAPKDAEKVWPVVKEHLKTYDFLFKTPMVDGYMVKDSIRDVDPAFQTDIDALMSRMLAENKVPFFELPTENQLEFIKRKVGLNENACLYDAKNMVCKPKPNAPLRF